MNSLNTRSMYENTMGLMQEPLAQTDEFLIGM